MYCFLVKFTNDFFFLMSDKNISAKSEESDYDYLKRTIGPGSWVYEILQDVNLSGQKKDWDILEMKLKNCGNDENQRRAIIKSFRFKRFKNN